MTSVLYSHTLHCGQGYNGAKIMRMEKAVGKVAVKFTNSFILGCSFMFCL